MATTLDVAKLRNLITVNRIDIAIAAVNIFEYVITFELERRRIWRSRLSAVTVIFLINRYLAVAYSISMILSLCVVTEASCRTFLLIPCAIFLGLGLIQGVFSSLRIRALWPNQGVLWPVIVFSLYLVPFATDIWDYSSVVPMEPQSFYHCAPQAGSSSSRRASIVGVVVANRLCVIAADIIVLWSTWLKTFRHRQELAGLGFTTNIPYLLLRDGTIGFLVLLCLNVLQILMASAPPWTDFAAVNQFSHWPALYPIVISRFLLSLRQVNDPIDPDDQACLTASRLDQETLYDDTKGILGNLGENLHNPFTRFADDSTPNMEQHGMTESLDMGKADDVLELEVAPLARV